MEDEDVLGRYNSSGRCADLDAFWRGNGMEPIIEQIVQSGSKNYLEIGVFLSTFIHATFLLRTHCN